MSLETLQTHQALQQESHHTTRDERIALLYSLPQARFIRSTLSTEELDIIDGTTLMDARDYIFIALANTIVKNNPKLAMSFDSYIRLDLSHYALVTVNWLKTQEYLVEKCNGHKPTGSELAKEFSKLNGSRHRVYYCLRYPDKVQKP